jgi:hypothetical protein
VIKNVYSWLQTEGRQVITTGVKTIVTAMINMVFNGVYQLAVKPIANKVLAPVDKKVNGFIEKLVKKFKALTNFIPPGIKAALVRMGKQAVDMLLKLVAPTFQEGLDQRVELAHTIAWASGDGDGGDGDGGDGDGGDGGDGQAMMATSEESFRRKGKFSWKRHARRFRKSVKKDLAKVDKAFKPARIMNLVVKKMGKLYPGGAKKIMAHAHKVMQAYRKAKRAIRRRNRKARKALIKHVKAQIKKAAPKWKKLTNFLRKRAGHVRGWRAKIGALKKKVKKDEKKVRKMRISKKRRL